MSVLPSFLDFSSCVGWPKNYTQATAKILLKHFHFSQYRFFEGNGESAAQVDRLPASELRRFTWSVAQLFFRKKNPMVIRKIQEPSERERFLQEEATGELEKVAKDERASLFSTLYSGISFFCSKLCLKKYPLLQVESTSNFA